MHENKIASAPVSANSRAVLPRRPHAVTMSFSEDDLAFLAERAAMLREQTGRNVIPVAAAAYDVFLAGREALGAGV